MTKLKTTILTGKSNPETKLNLALVKLIVESTDRYVLHEKRGNSARGWMLFYNTEETVDMTISLPITLSRLMMKLSDEFEKQGVGKGKRQLTTTFKALLEIE